MEEVQRETSLHYQLELALGQVLLQLMAQSVLPELVQLQQTVKERTVMHTLIQVHLPALHQEVLDKTLMAQEKDTQLQMAMKYLLDLEQVQRLLSLRAVTVQLVHQQSLELQPKLVKQLPMEQVLVQELLLVQQLDKLPLEVLVQLQWDQSELEHRVKEMLKPQLQLFQETALPHQMA
ncbi:MAG: hypothetical protein ACMG6E_04260 [Candidatus Roizmanbacteria bacterium]